MEPGILTLISASCGYRICVWQDLCPRFSTWDRPSSCLLASGFWQVSCLLSPFLLFRGRLSQAEFKIFSRSSVFSGKPGCVWVWILPAACPGPFRAFPPPDASFLPPPLSPAVSPTVYTALQARATQTLETTHFPSCFFFLFFELDNSYWSSTNSSEFFLGHLKCIVLFKSAMWVSLIFFYNVCSFIDIYYLMSQCHKFSLIPQTCLLKYFKTNL